MTQLFVLVESLNLYIAKMHTHKTVFKLTKISISNALKSVFFEYCSLIINTYSNIYFSGPEASIR